MSEWEKAAWKFYNKAVAQAEKEAKSTCLHDWVPTFQGGDTYRCTKCGKEIDMTEDDSE